MKRIEKILLFLLVLIYLTNIYSSVVATPSAHFIDLVTTFQIVESNSPSTRPRKSLIENHKQLPLTKKQEIGSHSTVINKDFDSKISSRYGLTLLLSELEYQNAPLRDHTSNKAPPFTC